MSQNNSCHNFFALVAVIVNIFNLLPAEMLLMALAYLFDISVMLFMGRCETHSLGKALHNGAKQFFLQKNGLIG